MVQKTNTNTIQNHNKKQRNSAGKIVFVYVYDFF